MKAQLYVSGWLCAAALSAPACVSLDGLRIKEDAGDARSAVETDSEVDEDQVDPEEDDVAPGPVISHTDGGVASQDCKCTRRPAGAPSRRCPWGSGSSSSEAIGEQGGIVRLSGTLSTVGVATQLKIPAGALQESIQLTITELKTAPPAGYVDYSPVYRVDPLDLMLESPGEIILGFSNQDGLIPNALSIYHADTPEGPFTRIPDSYINAGFLQATLMRGGYYFASYVTPEELRPCP